MNDYTRHPVGMPVAGASVSTPVRAAYLRSCAEAVVNSDRLGNRPTLPPGPARAPAHAMLEGGGPPITSTIIQHLGLRRENQEDAAVLVHHRSRMLDQNSDFYVGVLADGCGGSLGGEIASDLACSTIEAYLIAALSAPESWRSMEKVLRIAFAMANRSIIERAVADPTLQDMASTAVCVVVTGSLVYVAWAGDSRLTVWRTDAIHHVTKDHNRAQTLVDAGIITAEEAMLHPGKSHLTNALGIHEDDDAIPELTTFRIQAGDLLVLSSDGFHEGLTDAATARVCATHLAPPVTADSLRVLARTLESESLAHYGGDNLTAILMHIRSV